MKILFLSASSDLGGAEKVLLLIVRLLKHRHDFFLLTQDEGALAENFRKEGGSDVFILKIPAWRKISQSLNRMIFILRLAGIVRKQRIDLIHCNNYRLAPYAQWITRLWKVPHCLHLHDMETWRLLKKYSVHRSRSIVAVSQAAAKPFCGHGIPARVVYNAIDESVFIPPPDKENTGKRIGMIAHFHRIKRHSLFVDIAAELKNREPACEFFILGGDISDEGVSSMSILEYAKSKGVELHISRAGSEREVADFLHQIDLLLVPSEMEPFGLVILEAMATGVIVMAQHNSGGPQEIITHGVDGFFVDCTDAAGTAQKVSEILKDAALRRAVMTQARKTVSERFSRKIFLDQMEAVYCDQVDPKDGKPC